MSDPLLLALLAVIAALTVGLILLLWRRNPVDGGLARTELIDLRQRLDRLAQAQSDLPRALAETRAAQAEALSGQVAHLATLLTRQLDAANQSVGRRLDDTGRAVADVRERLGQLSEATRRLESVGEAVIEVQELLRVPRLRGTLGEVWLEELLRQVLPPAHFEMQYTFRTGTRVDAVIRVGEQLVPIDAKFPLEACQRMLALDGDAAEREWRAFRRSLRARIDEIADKYIRPEDGTLEFALMYIPAESVYYETVVRGASLDDGDGLLGYAMNRRVIPVSPHTFYAYLSAVLYGLKGLAVERRAREIQADLGELEQEFARFAGSWDKVGTHLTNAQKQFAESQKAAERIAERLERVTNEREE